MAFDLAYRRAGFARTQACPGCGEPELRLLFLVNATGSERGTAVFWCDHCRRGLMPLTTPVPDGAETIVRGNETIPNYTIVPEQ